MELITIGSMIISGVFGALIGLITITTGDSKIKIIIQTTGLVAILFGLFTLIPHVEWATPTAETCQTISNSITLMIYPLIVYAIGDACGSLGENIVTDLF